MPARGEKVLRGRPEKISKELVDRVANFIRGGAYIEQAGLLAGVPRATLYSWMERGHKEPESIYKYLLDTVERALAEAEMRDLQVIDAFAQGRAPVVRDGQVVEEAIKKNPNWAAWRLERRFPKRWGKKDSLDLTQKDGLPELPKSPENYDASEEIQDLLEKLKLTRTG